MLHKYPARFFQISNKMGEGLDTMYIGSFAYYISMKQGDSLIFRFFLDKRA